MGKYHPHGNLAIYDALVRLAQDFSMRAAADRRPGQLRLRRRRSAGGRALHGSRGCTKVAGDLLDDLDKDTVDFKANYDGTLAGAVGAAGEVSQPAGQRRGRHRRRHGDEHPAAQSGRSDRRAAWRISTIPRSPSTSCARSCPGPDFPTGRPDPRARRHPLGLSQGPRLDHHARQGRRSRTSARTARRSSSRRSPIR